MVKQSSRTTLVTECSSGIGRATALRLHRAGLVVHATGRRPQAPMSQPPILWLPHSELTGRQATAIQPIRRQSRNATIRDRHQLQIADSGRPRCAC
jgi:NAD(P)-dependent dehydrogenase (short-subunit alcohol dehydrogenase family)